MKHSEGHLHVKEILKVSVMAGLHILLNLFNKTKTFINFLFSFIFSQTYINYLFKKCVLKCQNLTILLTVLPILYHRVPAQSVSLCDFPYFS